MVYRLLVRLYPCDYRVWFAGEMLAALGQEFRFSEAVSLLAGAAVEWWDKWTTDAAVRARSVPDLRMMRPPGVPRETYFAAACVNAWNKNTCSSDISPRA
jgi:hypothetical protein